MALQYLSSPMVPLPAAADGVTVTSSTSAWADVTWVEIDASIASDSLLASIVAFTTSTNQIQFEVDIGRGTAGNEVVVSTIKGRTQSTSNVGDDAVFHLPIPIDAFTAGDRVSARIRTNATSAIDWRISISVIAIPYVGSLLTTANPVKVTTPAAAFTTLTTTHATPWTDVAYVQVLASAAADLVIVGVAGFVNAAHGEIDIATGTAGNEVVKATVAFVNGAITRNCQVMFPIPLDVIASGVRVAARARASSGNRGAVLALMYQEKPL